MHSFYATLTTHNKTQGATPPAVGWAAIDLGTYRILGHLFLCNNSVDTYAGWTCQVLLGALHNFRLHMRQYSFFRESISTSDTATRLTLLGHGVAGLGAGLTRCLSPQIWSNFNSSLNQRIHSNANRAGKRFTFSLKSICSKLTAV